MFDAELISPYTDIEEYAELSTAYISTKGLLGFEQEEETYPVNEYLLLINDEEPETILFKKIQSMFDTFTGMREPLIVNPTPRTVENCGVGIMDEREKTVDELFKEAYDACEATDISQLSIEDFIQYCEELYNMETDFFLEWFEERNCEGNVDMQMWALYAKNQKDDGVDV